MKKLFLFLLIHVCVPVAVIKATPVFPSVLNIRLCDSTSFTMVIDDIHYSHPSNIFNVNLFPGLHAVKVLRANAIPTVLFDGMVEMPYNTNVFALIEYPSNFKVYHIETYGYGNDSYPGNAMEIGTSPTVGMSSLNFYNLKVQLRRSNTSLEKMKIAKRSVSQDKISSGQLAEVIKLVEFEAHRIELAKFAYPFAIDKENYSLIDDSFSFESSAKEVAEYIETFKSR